MSTPEPASPPADAVPATPAPAPATPAKRARRLNADYRWTMPKVLSFLDALATCGRVAEAARMVGMSRQSAYRMRARLAGTQVAAAFEGARRQGLRARAAASRERMRSRWEGERLGEWLARAQGDTRGAQGDTPPPQGGAPARQGDATTPKVTKLPLDRVTPGPCRGPGWQIPAGSTGGGRSRRMVRGPR